MNRNKASFLLPLLMWNRNSSKAPKCDNIKQQHVWQVKILSGLRFSDEKDSEKWLQWTKIRLSASTWSYRRDSTIILFLFVSIIQRHHEYPLIWISTSLASFNVLGNIISMILHPDTEIYLEFALIRVRQVTKGDFPFVDICISASKLCMQT